MSKRLLAEVTAEYVLKNRENGWLKYALQVLAAEPYLRCTLIGELCEDVRQAIEQRLPKHKVWVEVDEEVWFSVNVTREAWDELGVGIGTWKDDASQMAIGVYNGGTGLSDSASAQIRECLATKRRPWNRPSYPEWIWNISPDWSNWSDRDFLMRVADDRQVVVSEVAKDVLEIVELVDAMLTRVASADEGKPRPT